MILPSIISTCLALSAQFQGSEPDLVDIHNLIFSNQSDDVEAEAKLLPPLTATIQYPAGKAVANVEFKFVQESLVGLNFPSKPIAIESGRTDEEGKLSVAVHPYCEIWSLWYQLPDQPWRLLEHGELQPERFALGRLTLPKEVSISGNIASSSDGRTYPVKAWLWESASGVGLPGMPHLPDHFLLCENQSDWNRSAESIRNIRNESDLRRSDDVGIELELEENHYFRIRARVNGPAIGVMDNHGCLHWFDGFQKWDAPLELALPDQVEYRVQIMDWDDIPATGARVAAGGMGGFSGQEILRPVGKVGPDGWLSVTSYDGKIPTIVARWHSGDPWYTCDQRMDNDGGDDKSHIYILPRARTVSVAGKTPTGQEMRSGGISVVDTRFMSDPRAAKALRVNFKRQNYAQVKAAFPSKHRLPLLHSHRYFPMPAKIKRSDNRNTLYVEAAPIGPLTVFLGDYGLPENFFPARVSVISKGTEIPVSRWLREDHTVYFRQIIYSPSEVVLASANGESYWIDWEGDYDYLEVRGIE